jgi:hypothetical protein
VFGPLSVGGFTTGEPQVAQNFADPINSAPHFPQFAIGKSSTPS